MKAKKLKKLIENSVRDAIQNHTYPIKSTEPEVDLADYNEEISERFKSLVLNIINYRNNLNINITSERIGISCDSVKNIKGLKSNYNSDEDYLEINIRKGVGFWLNNGYKLRSNYRDDNIYDELLPVISEKLKEINSDNFDQVWSKIMKESGIIRDNNLDEILS
jgi:hypothetical protein